MVPLQARTKVFFRAEFSTIGTTLEKILRAVRTDGLGTLAPYVSMKYFPVLGADVLRGGRGRDRGSDLAPRHQHDDPHVRTDAEAALQTAARRQAARLAREAEEGTRRKLTRTCALIISKTLEFNI